VSVYELFERPPGMCLVLCNANCVVVSLYQKLTAWLYTVSMYWQHNRSLYPGLSLYTCTATHVRYRRYLQSQ